MKVRDLSIVEFLEGRKESFLIPVYQRNYDWTKERCETLWMDLEAVVTNPHPHFFGSLVRVRDGNDNVIIDGQQRLTTVSLLMLAIAHRVEDLGLEKPDLREVMDLYQNGQHKPKIKLKLLREDMQAYECIIAHNRDCSNYKKSNIVKNYNFFLKKLDAENIEKIFEATKRLISIDVLLEAGDDNPQAVFESLNDKAEKLNEADKIRNFILMNFNYEKQQILYDECWAPMEQNVGINSEDTTKYIWRYMQYKTNNTIRDKDTYYEFKSYVKNKEKEEVLKDLCKMSGVYKEILQHKVTGTNAEDINQRLDWLLNELKLHTVVPLLIDVINEYYTNKISGIDVVEILDVLISYFVRRGLVGTYNAGYGNFFLINNEVHSLLEEFPMGSYVDILKYKLHKASDRHAVPTDEHIKENAINLGVYNKTISVCRYVLTQLEKHMMLLKDPNKQLDLIPNNLSIEHIMPQKLTGPNGEKWKKELGDNWEYVHTKYLHTLGNLTLTGYNSNLSNSSFDRKKRELKNFTQLHLNEFINNTSVWNEASIRKRSEELAKLILELWPIYKPQNKYEVQQNYDVFFLDNDNLRNVVTKRQPKEVDLTFMDIQLKVSNWRDLYTSVINELYNSTEYHTKMQHAFDWADKSDAFAGIVSANPQIRSKSGAVLWEQIIPDNSIYFKTVKSAEDICVALKKWMKYLNIEPVEMTIVLR